MLAARIAGGLMVCPRQSMAERGSWRAAAIVVGRDRAVSKCNQPLFITPRDGFCSSKRDLLHVRRLYPRRDLPRGKPARSLLHSVVRQP